MKRFDKGSFWNPDDEKFYFSQKEMKVGEEKNNNFVSDSEFYLLDQYWLFSIYFLIGDSSDQTTVMGILFFLIYTTKRVAQNGLVQLSSHQF
jgi:hypothetical protein